MKETSYPSVSGFTPLVELCAQLLWNEDEPENGEIVNVSYGHDTKWNLVIELAFTNEISRWIIFDNIVSFRIQDESEIYYYWRMRNSEGIKPCSAYEIGRSQYLDEIKLGIAAQGKADIRHFLFGGRNNIVEIIAFENPTVSASKPIFG